MRLVNYERGFLFWSVVSLLAIFLAGSVTNVKGFPMMMEVDEDEERVSSLIVFIVAASVVVNCF
jgi:hypothetical protein